MILHEPDEEFAAIFLRQAADHNILVTTTTARSSHKTTQEWLRIHPFETRAGLASLIPTSTNVLVNFKDDETSGRLSGLIRSYMPANSLFLDGANAIKNYISFGEADKGSSVRELAQLLESACYSASQELPDLAADAYLERVKSAMDVSVFDVSLSELSPKVLSFLQVEE